MAKGGDVHLDDMPPYTISWSENADGTADRKLLDQHSVSVGSSIIIYLPEQTGVPSLLWVLRIGDDACEQDQFRLAVRDKEEKRMVHDHLKVRMRMWFKHLSSKY